MRRRARRSRPHVARTLLAVGLMFTQEWRLQRPLESGVARLLGYRIISFGDKRRPRVARGRRDPLSARVATPEQQRRAAGLLVGRQPSPSSNSESVTCGAGSDSSDRLNLLAWIVQRELSNRSG